MPGRARSRCGMSSPPVRRRRRRGRRCLPRDRQPAVRDLLGPDRLVWPADTRYESDGGATAGGPDCGPNGSEPACAGAVTGMSCEVAESRSDAEGKPRALDQATIGHIRAGRSRLNCRAEDVAQHQAGHGETAALARRRSAASLLGQDRHDVCAADRRPRRLAGPTGLRTVNS
jgi:hypothetical protein